jgi:hypothetical protein
MTTLTGGTASGGTVSIGSQLGLFSELSSQVIQQLVTMGAAVPGPTARDICELAGDFASKRYR